MSDWRQLASAAIRWIESQLSKAMNWAKDFANGFSIAAAVVLPAFVVLLAFQKPDQFEFLYMKEVSLLVLWAVFLYRVLQPKSVKIGKDSFEISFDARPIPPNQAAI